ncbi:MAG: hypothetical protein ACKOAD_06225, partial [Gammaproteobacteria bacterium]
VAAIHMNPKAVSADRTIELMKLMDWKQVCIKQFLEHTSQLNEEDFTITPSLMQFLSEVEKQLRNDHLIVRAIRSVKTKYKIEVLRSFEMPEDSKCESDVIYIGVVSSVDGKEPMCKLKDIKSNVIKLSISKMLENKYYFSSNTPDHETKKQVESNLKNLHKLLNNIASKTNRLLYKQETALSKIGKQTKAKSESNGETLKSKNLRLKTQNDISTVRQSILDTDQLIKEQHSSYLQASQEIISKLKKLVTGSVPSLSLPGKFDYLSLSSYAPNSIPKDITDSITSHEKLTAEHESKIKGLKEKKTLHENYIQIHTNHFSKAIAAIISKNLSGQTTAIKEKLISFIQDNPGTLHGTNFQMLTEIRELLESKKQQFLYDKEKRDAIEAIINDSAFFDKIEEILDNSDSCLPDFGKPEFLSYIMVYFGYLRECFYARNLLSVDEPWEYVRKEVFDSTEKQPHQFEHVPKLAGHFIKLLKATNRLRSIYSKELEVFIKNNHDLLCTQYFNLRACLERMISFWNKPLEKKGESQDQINKKLDSYYTQLEDLNKDFNCLNLKFDYEERRYHRNHISCQIFIYSEGIKICNSPKKSSNYNIFIIRDSELKITSVLIDPSGETKFDEEDFKKKLGECITFGNESLLKSAVYDLCIEEGYIKANNLPRSISSDSLGAFPTVLNSYLKQNPPSFSAEIEIKQTIDLFAKRTIS